MVSIRKRKGQINDKFLQRLKQNKSQELSAAQVGDELFSGVMEGIEDELQKNPVLRTFLHNYTELYKDFIEGIREGINEEIAGAKLSSDVTVLSKAVIEANENSNQEVVNAIDEMAETVSEAIKNSKKEESNYQELSKEEILSARQYVARASEDILSKSSDFYKPKLGASGEIKKFALSLLDNNFLFDRLGVKTKFVENFERKEQWIQAQQKLTPELSRKELSKNYNKVQDGIKQLEKLEKHKNILKSQGYSDDQIEKIINYSGKLRDQLSNIVPYDKRFEKYKDILDKPIIGSNLLKTEEVNLEDSRYKEEVKDIQKDQLDLLNLIKEELEKLNGNTQQPTTQGNSPLDISSLMGKGLSGKGGGILNKIKNIASTGLAFATKNPMTILKGTGALAVAGGAYEAYSGYNQASREQESELSNIDQQLKEGLITKEEAEKQKKSINELAIENKGGALGKGTGIALGAIGGAKAGAILGSMIAPGVGTLIGGLLGSVVGGFSGSSVGQNIGGLLGKGINFFTRSDEVKDKEQIITPSGEVIKRETGVTDKLMTSVKETEVLTTKEIAKEIGTNIKINVPPAIVPQQSEKVVPTPFIYNMKNNEPSISSYIRSRYAY